MTGTNNWRSVSKGSGARKSRDSRTALRLSYVLDVAVRRDQEPDLPTTGSIPLLQLLVRPGDRTACVLVATSRKELTRGTELQERIGQRGAAEPSRLSAQLGLEPHRCLLQKALQRRIDVSFLARPTVRVLCEPLLPRQNLTDAVGVTERRHVALTVYNPSSLSLVPHRLRNRCYRVATWQVAIWVGHAQERAAVEPHRVSNLVGHRGRALREASPPPAPAPTPEAPRSNKRRLDSASLHQRTFGTDVLRSPHSTHAVHHVGRFGVLARIRRGVASA
jgi:hypothetical protein